MTKLLCSTLAPVLVLSLAACSQEAANGGEPASTSAPAAKAAATDERKYLLERVDDAAVAQLYADGFEALPLKEKTLIWHLYQAAIAGRDIFYDQKHRDALAMREILEQIVTHAQGIDQATLAEIQRYTKLFWINNGPYNNLTARKFVMKSHAGSLCLRRADGGEKWGGASHSPNGEAIDAVLARLQPMFFDPNVDPIVTNKTPGAGQATSCRQAPTICTRASAWPT